MVERFLYEKLLLHSFLEESNKEQCLLPPVVQGCQSNLSPDQQLLAVVSPSQLTVSIVSIAELQQTQPKHFSSTVVLSQGSKKAELTVPDILRAIAWTADSQGLVVAGLHGSVYILNRTGELQQVWLASNTKGGTLPWAKHTAKKPASSQVVGAAVVDQTLLIATSNAEVYFLDMKGTVEEWEKARPKMHLQGMHAGLRGIAFDHTTQTLVCVGPGSSGTRTPGACVSLWRWQNSSLAAWRSHGNTRVGSASSTTAVSSPWSISWSPDRQHIAVVPSSPGQLILISMKDGLIVDLGPQSRQEGPQSCFQMTQDCKSAAWWTASSLALTGHDGSLGLAMLPSLDNQIGLPDSPVEKCMPGSVINVTTAGPDSGLLLLQPSQPPTGGWQLHLLAHRNHQQLLHILCTAKEWSQATRLCRLYNMDANVVLRAQWSSQLISKESITTCLAQITDLDWVVQQVLSGRAAMDAPIQHMLLSHALDVSTQQCQAADQQAELDGGHSLAVARAARRTRLKLLSHVDRLNLLLALHRGQYDPDAYTALRDAPLIEAAQSWAAMGDVESLSYLLAAWPSCLGPHLLALLNSLPETLDPRTYAHLLPRVSSTPMTVATVLQGSKVGAADSRQHGIAARDADWVESQLTVRELMDGYSEMVEATENLSAIAHSLQPGIFPALPVEDIELWYSERAVHLDVSARNLPGAAALLELGLSKGCSQAGTAGKLAKAAKLLISVLSGLSTTPPQQGTYQQGSEYDASITPVWLITLDAFAAMKPAEQLCLLMRSSTKETLAEDIKNRAAPLLLSQPSEAAHSIVSHLIHSELAARPEWCVALVATEVHRPRLLPDTLRLAAVVLNAINTCPRADAWSQYKQLLDELQEGIDNTLADAVSNGDASKQQVCENATASLRRAKNLVSAGSLLAKYGQQCTVPDITGLDAQAAQELLQKLLNGVERSSSSWSTRDWSTLWDDLKQLHASSVMGALSLPHLLQQYVGLLLRVGRLDIAKPYLATSGGSSGSSGGVVAGAALPAVIAEQLIATAAGELLASASALDDPAVTRAKALLGMAPSHSKAAQQELALLTILDRLSSAGVALLPAQVKQFQSTLQAADSAVPPSLRLFQWLLQQGKPQRLHRQLDVLLEVVGLLGLDDDVALLNQAKLMIAEAAGQVGDWDSVAGLVVGLVEEGVEAAAPLATQLATSRAGAGLEPATQRLLLRGAALHASDEQLPAVLDSLLTADMACLPSEAQDMLAAPHEYHLRRALSLPHQHIPLPNPGDVPVSLSILCAAPSAMAAEQMIMTVLGDSNSDQQSLEHDLSAIASSVSFATLQRVVGVGIQALAIRVLTEGGHSSPAQIQAWLHIPPMVLLEQASSQAATSDDATHALAAAQRLARLLKAAQDARTVKSVVPAAQAATFLAGDPTQRLEALLQQSAVAGQQAAGLLPDGTTAAATAGGASAVSSGIQLLNHALQLASQYGLQPDSAAWRIRATFVCVTLKTAKTISQELNQAIMAQSQQLLQPSTVNGQSGALLLLSLLSDSVWPSIPATSAPHLSLTVALINACLAALPAPMPGMQQRLSKLCDLLDKAGGALRGLALAPVLTPLLRTAIGPLSLPPCPQLPNAQAMDSQNSKAALLRSTSTDGDSSPGGSDARLPGLTADAQGAVFAYSSHTTVGATSKLLKALQAIFAPSAGDAGMDAAGLAKVLSALPTALPYLCLLCKAGLPATAAAVTNVQQAHTLDLEAWHALRAVCLDRVASGQLRAWMEFALLGGKQPLSSTAAGKLPTPRCLTEVQLAIIKDGLLQLPEIQALTGTGAGPQGGSMRRDKPLPEATHRLVALYGRLFVLQALEASSTLPHQVKATEEQAIRHACSPAALRGSTPPATACALLGGLIRAHLTSGTALTDISSMVQSAWPEEALLPVARDTCGYTDYKSSEDLVNHTFLQHQSNVLQALVHPQQSAETALETNQPTLQLDETSAVHALHSLVQVLVPQETDEQQTQHQQPAVSSMSGSSPVQPPAASEGWDIDVDIALEGSTATEPTETAVETAEAVDSQQTPSLANRLRQGLLDGIHAAVESLDSSQYGRPAAAALLAVHLSLLNGKVWPGWHPAAGSSALLTGSSSGAAAQLQSRMLLASSLAHVQSTWPKTSGTDAPVLTLEDVSDADSAVTAFHRMLQQVDESHTSQQLECLYSLLEDVWQRGNVFSASSSQPSVDNAAEEATQQQQTAPGQQMHACYHALLLTTAKAQQHDLFVKMIARMNVSSTASMGQSFVLRHEDVCDLAQSIASIPEPSGLPTHSALAALLAISCRYQDQHTECVRLLQQYGSPFLCDCTSPVVAYTLAVRLLRAQLLSTDSSLPAKEQAVVADVLIAFARANSYETQHPLLLPCLVSQLCMAKQFTQAAALSAQACHWTTALRALGGCLSFLDHFLGVLAGRAGGLKSLPEVHTSEFDRLSDIADEWVRAARQAIKEAMINA